MHGDRAALMRVETIAALAQANAEAVELALCVPATLLTACADLARGGAMAIGAQDCADSCLQEGARTGDISAAMIADAGAAYVIVGHSERRTLHGETGDCVRRKSEAAMAAGLSPIICVGETLAERNEGRTIQVLEGQLAACLPIAMSEGLAIAYEPVWAIGAQVTPDLHDIAAAHRAIEGVLDERWPGASVAVRILYGGAVGPANAHAILATECVHGALVGRASLALETLAAIVEAAGNRQPV